jgi:hypothetical protein
MYYIILKFTTQHQIYSTNQNLSYFFTLIYNL